MQRTALNQDQVTGSDTNDPMADGSDGDGEPDVEFKIELFPISYQTGSAKDELWAVWSLFWEDSESDNARSYTMESLRTRFPNFAPDGLRLIINMLKERSLIGEVLQGGAFAYHLA
ncbi:hypothetical protein SARC_02978 [Sphaeroforma arctica JP610]|uniref:Uncharacterized protein n=1 Tax=Sphaeroforma arctica JP610 TaxID=667725 RepID=A0A0L0G972_9EUKA|nr:hypothetical protein SARC_02978 [Sphaeroforma arctica JP610]KNC84803.1 hypothetical protein SARC_02978 [Sphaeroforma arctica JP610]|eukprot:XP_014158705.1 hypothetical protein SARC_02978 [Sphaeroforma arctica JP610]